MHPQRIQPQTPQQQQQQQQQRQLALLQHLAQHSQAGGFVAGAAASPNASLLHQGSLLGARPPGLAPPAPPPPPPPPLSSLPLTPVVNAVSAVLPPLFPLQTPPAAGGGSVYASGAAAAAAESIAGGCATPATPLLPWLRPPQGAFLGLPAGRDPQQQRAQPVWQQPPIPVPSPPPPFAVISSVPLTAGLWTAAAAEGDARSRVDDAGESCAAPEASLSTENAPESQAGTAAAAVAAALSLDAARTLAQQRHPHQHHQHQHFEQAVLPERGASAFVKVPEKPGGAGETLLSGCGGREAAEGGIPSATEAPLAEPPKEEAAALRSFSSETALPCSSESRNSLSLASLPDSERPTADSKATATAAAEAGVSPKPAARGSSARERKPGDSQCTKPCFPEAETAAQQGLLAAAEESVASAPEEKALFSERRADADLPKSPPICPQGREEGGAEALGGCEFALSSADDQRPKGPKTVSAAEEGGGDLLGASERAAECEATPEAGAEEGGVAVADSEGNAAGLDSSSGRQQRRRAMRAAAPLLSRRRRRTCSDEETSEKTSSDSREAAPLPATDSEAAAEGPPASSSKTSLSREATVDATATLETTQATTTAASTQAAFQGNEEEGPSAGVEASLEEPSGEPKAPTGQTPQQQPLGADGGEGFQSPQLRSTSARLRAKTLASASACNQGTPVADEKKRNARTFSSTPPRAAPASLPQTQSRPSPSGSEARKEAASQGNSQVSPPDGGGSVSTNKLLTGTLGAGGVFNKPRRRSSVEAVENIAPPAVDWSRLQQGFDEEARKLPRTAEGWDCLLGTSPTCELPVEVAAESEDFQLLSVCLSPPQCEATPACSEGEPSLPQFVIWLREKVDPCAAPVVSLLLDPDATAAAAAASEAPLSAEDSRLVRLTLTDSDVNEASIQQRPRPLHWRQRQQQQQQQQRLQQEQPEGSGEAASGNADSTSLNAESSAAPGVGSEGTLRVKNSSNSKHPPQRSATAVASAEAAVGENEQALRKGGVEGGEPLLETQEAARLPKKMAGLLDSAKKLDSPRLEVLLRVAKQLALLPAWTAEDLAWLLQLEPPNQSLPGEAGDSRRPTPSPLEDLGGAVASAAETSDGERGRAASCGRKRPAAKASAPETETPEGGGQGVCYFAGPQSEASLTERILSAGFLPAAVSAAAAERSARRVQERREAQRSFRFLHEMLRGVGEKASDLEVPLPSSLLFRASREAHAAAAEMWQALLCPEQQQPPQRRRRQILAPEASAGVYGQPQGLDFEHGTQGSRRSGRSALASCDEERSASMLSRLSAGGGVAGAGFSGGAAEALPRGSGICCACSLDEIDGSLEGVTGGEVFASESFVGCRFISRYNRELCVRVLRNCGDVLHLQPQQQETAFQQQLQQLQLRGEGGWLAPLLRIPASSYVPCFHEDRALEVSAQMLEAFGLLRLPTTKANRRLKEPRSGPAAWGVQAWFSLCRRAELDFYFQREGLRFPPVLMLRIANAEFRFLVRWGAGSGGVVNPPSGAAALAAAATAPPEPPLEEFDFLGAFKRTVRLFKLKNPPTVKTLQQEIDYKKAAMRYVRTPLYLLHSPFVFHAKLLALTSPTGGVGAPLPELGVEPLAASEKQTQAAALASPTSQQTPAGASAGEPVSEEGSWQPTSAGPSTRSQSCAAAGGVSANGGGVAEGGGSRLRLKVLNTAPPSSGTQTPTHGRPSSPAEGFPSGGGGASACVESLGVGNVGCGGAEAISNVDAGDDFGEGGRGGAVAVAAALAASSRRRRVLRRRLHDGPEDSAFCEDASGRGLGAACSPPSLPREAFRHLGFRLEAFPQFVCGGINRHAALRSKRIRAFLSRGAAAANAVFSSAAAAACAGESQGVGGASLGGNSTSRCCRQIEVEEFNEGEMLLAANSPQKIEQEVEKFRLRPLVEAVHRMQALPQTLQVGLLVQVALTQPDGSGIFWWDAEVSSVSTAEDRQAEEKQQSLGLTVYLDEHSQQRTAVQVRNFLPPNIPVSEPRDGCWRLRPTSVSPRKQRGEDVSLGVVGSSLAYPQQVRHTDVWPGAIVCVSSADNACRLFDALVLDVFTSPSCAFYARQDGTRCRLVPPAASADPSQLAAASPSKPEVGEGESAGSCVSSRFPSAPAVRANGDVPLKPLQGRRQAEGVSVVGVRLFLLTERTQLSVSASKVRYRLCFDIHPQDALHGLLPQLWVWAVPRVLPLSPKFAEAAAEHQRQAAEGGGRVGPQDSTTTTEALSRHSPAAAEAAGSVSSQKQTATPAAAGALPAQQASAAASTATAAPSLGGSAAASQPSSSAEAASLAQTPSNAPAVQPPPLKRSCRTRNSSQSGAAAGPSTALVHSSPQRASSAAAVAAARDVRWALALADRLQLSPTGVAFARNAVFYVPADLQLLPTAYSNAAQCRRKRGRPPRSAAAAVTEEGSAFGEGGEVSSSLGNSAAAPAESPPQKKPLAPLFATGLAELLQPDLDLPALMSGCWKVRPLEWAFAVKRHLRQHQLGLCRRGAATGGATAASSHASKFASHNSPHPPPEGPLSYGLSAHSLALSQQATLGSGNGGGRRSPLCEGVEVEEGLSSACTTAAANLALNPTGPSPSGRTRGRKRLLSRQPEGASALDCQNAVPSKRPLQRHPGARATSALKAETGEAPSLAAAEPRACDEQQAFSEGCCEASVKLDWATMKGEEDSVASQRQSPSVRTPKEDDACGEAPSPTRAARARAAPPQGVAASSLLPHSSKATSHGQDQRQHQQSTPGEAAGAAALAGATRRATGLDSNSENVKTLSPEASPTQQASAKAVSRSAAARYVQPQHASSSSSDNLAATTK